MCVGRGGATRRHSVRGTPPHTHTPLGSVGVCVCRVGVLCEAGGCGAGGAVSSEARRVPAGRTAAQRGGWGGGQAGSPVLPISFLRVWFFFVVVGFFFFFSSFNMWGK